MKFCPNGDPPPPAVTKVYPHLTVAPRLLEYFVPGTGWKMAGPDVYATRDTIAWLRQYPKATSVGIAVGPHRVADFAVAELLR